MTTDPRNVARALELLGQLNDSEQLRIAERLLEFILARLGPMTDPALCIAEGYLSAALPSIEQARGMIEAWPDSELPADPDGDAG